MFPIGIGRRATRALGQAVGEAVGEATGGGRDPQRRASVRRQRARDTGAEARRYVNGVSLLAFFLCLLVGIALLVSTGSPAPLLAAIAVGVFLLFALKVANQWERAVVLRFGRFV
ncbi:MAG: hypothetical protein ACXWFQ_08715, partial [Thermoanaerobaculia bacterium]